MGKPRLLIGMASTALALLVLAAPVSGSDTKGTLAIVNGLPGKKVDICLNGREIKSGLPYGGKVLKDVVTTGSKNLKLYEHDRRACRGRRLGQETFTLGAGDDLTIVASKNFPKLVHFNNAASPYLGEIPPEGPADTLSYLAIRHGGDLAITFRSRSWSPNPEGPVGTSADPISVKRQQAVYMVGPDQIWRVRATLPNDAETIAGKAVQIVASHRYELIFVGTRPGNAKIVLLDRAVSLPSP